MYTDKENQNPREMGNSKLKGFGKGMPTIADDMQFDMSADDEDDDAGEEKKVWLILYSSYVYLTILFFCI